MSKDPEEMINTLSRGRNPGSHVRARRMLEGAEPEIIRALAVDYLAAAATDRARSRTLAAERAAQRDDRAAEAREHRRQKREQKARAKTRGFDSVSDMLWSDMWDSIERVKMEWTQELLDATFAMPDGTRVAWGDATITQHEARASMFRDNATANLEGAARHLFAAQELTDNGCKNLRQLTQRKSKQARRKSA